MTVDLNALVCIPTAAVVVCALSALIRKIFSLSGRAMTLTEIALSSVAAAIAGALSGADVADIAVYAASISGVSLAVCGIFCKKNGEGAADVALGKKLIEAAFALLRSRKKISSADAPTDQGGDENDPHALTDG